MILNIKFFITLTLVSFGFYFFYKEYNTILKLDLTNLKFENIEKKSIVENKVIDIEIPKNVDRSNIQKKDSKLIKNEIIVLKGDTFLSILKKYNLPEKKIFEIVNSIEKYYNLKKLRVNDSINIYQNKNNEVEKIEMYSEIDRLLIIKIKDDIKIKIKKLDKNTYESSEEFYIYESLYADGLKKGLPQDILINLIKLFSFDIDFQRDIKKNTKVSISYEFDLINENNRIQYKDINYALISIDNKPIEYFRFLTDDGFVDYFNREGKNVKKSILKTPLDGARLSSSFGMRKHPISGFNKMHKGVDFAAPKGTPIYAGGNGVIEYIGRNGGYGNYIRIRHNNNYKTAYAHLSNFKKGISKGTRVNQGDVIGFVGSTGVSTGPHLHYEIIFNNKQINPMKLKLPSGKILKGEELERFKKHYKILYANHLNLLFE